MHEAGRCWATIHNFPLCLLEHADAGSFDSVYLIASLNHSTIHRDEQT